MFVRMNSLMKRWTSAKGDLRRCPVDQTFCSDSSISKVTMLYVKLKATLDDEFGCEERPRSS